MAHFRTQGRRRASRGRSAVVVLVLGVLAAAPSVPAAATAVGGDDAVAVVTVEPSPVGDPTGATPTSPPSDTVSGTSEAPVAGQAADEAPQPPVEVRYTDIRRDRVVVAWGAPRTGPPPTAYRVAIWEAGAAPEGATTYETLPTELTRELTGLRPNTRYHLTVVSVAGELTSPPATSRPDLWTRATPNVPVGKIETVTGSVNTFVLTGWAVDPDVAGPIEVMGSRLPWTVADEVREDIGAAYPGTGDRHGFTVTWSDPLAQPGNYQVCVRGVDRGEAGTIPFMLLDCVVVTVTEPPPAEVPVGEVESLTVSGPTLTVRGWAVEPAGTEDAVVEYVVDREWGDVTTTNLPRPDVGDAFPRTGNLHGFEVVLDLEPGEHEVCAWAFVEWTELERFLGCHEVTITDTLPIGNFESSTASRDTVTLTGWALDRDDPGPVDVHFTVNDAWGGSVRTDVPRGDIVRAYPAAGDRQGFSYSFRAGPGTHRVCAYAIDTTYGDSTPLGCRSVTVAGPPANRLPLANFESLTTSGTAVTLSGWAVDPDVAGPIDVHFYVNGGWGGSVSTTGVRSDVGRAYPGTGDQHGFSRTFTAGPGTHQICTYAIDTTTKANTPMGCRTVTVAAPVNRLPLANFEALTASGSTVTLTGWALDPDHVGAIDVHFYVNGGWGGSVSTTGVRSDVARAYPGTGDQHGFTRAFTAGPGTHQICTYAIDTTTRANTPMGCRTITVR